MKVEEDLSNLPKPGVIFIATKFIIADDWNDPPALWDDGVLVSFQENSWVDSTTYQTT